MVPRRCCACISAPGSFMFLNGKLHLMSISFGVISNQYFVGSPFQLHQDMDKLYHQCAQPSPTLVYPISNSISQEALTYSIQTARVRTLSEASEAWRQTVCRELLTTKGCGLFTLLFPACALQLDNEPTDLYPSCHNGLAAILSWSKPNQN